MSARRRIAEYGSERKHREVHRLVLRAVAIVAGGVGLATAVFYFLKTPRTPPATSAVTSRSTDGSESPPGVAR